MSDIRERVFVACPLAHARRYLARVLPVDSPVPQRLELRLPVPVPGAAGAGLEHEVIATWSPAQDPTHESEPWHLSWAPRNRRLYPSFDGTLAIMAGEDYESCRLVLEGSYVPPLGVAGEVFDAAVGRRIAEATGRELLRTIASRMEEAYRADAAQKQAPGGEPSD